MAHTMSYKKHTLTCASLNTPPCFIRLETKYFYSMHLDQYERIILPLAFFISYLHDLDSSRKLLWFAPKSLILQVPLLLIFQGLRLILVLQFLPRFLRFCSLLPTFLDCDCKCKDENDQSGDKWNSIECLIEHKLIKKVGINDAHVGDQANKATRIVLERKCAHKETSGVTQGSSDQEAVLATCVLGNFKAISCHSCLNHDVAAELCKPKNAVTKYDEIDGDVL